MKCPHCLENFFESWTVISLGRDRDWTWGIAVTVCPSCKRNVAKLGALGAPYNLSATAPVSQFTDKYIVLPKATSRAQLPSDVPTNFADDYREACLVLADSPKASAALSRRCLQHLLRTQEPLKHGNLYNEIQQVLDSGKLPTYLSTAIDAVRVIGNFAAHPIKSTNSGEITDVEPGEAEWSLDTLEGLFDFYFVQPAELAKKRAALNDKLQQAEKPPLK